MPLKTVEIEGVAYAEVKDGKAVYVDDKGEETAYDAEDLATKLTASNGENATRRHKIKELETQLGAFSGIEDADAARKALETIKGLDDKQLIDAGKANEVKAAAVQAIEEKYTNLIDTQYKPLEGERDTLRDALHREMIGGRFSRSQYITEKMAVPVQMVQATFGSHFTIEDDTVVARDAKGNQIYSKQRFGEPADFDEALEIIVETSPYREQILKGAGKRGSDAPGPGSGRHAAGDKVMNRADADKLVKENPGEMAKRMRDGWVVTDEAA